VKAFLDAVCDPTMMDRWIPDEDWVHQIPENGKNDCSIVNFNTGMSQQCLWQNNNGIEGKQNQVRERTLGTRYLF
jgi:hypothetical protein